MLRVFIECTAISRTTSVSLSINVYFVVASAAIALEPGTRLKAAAAVFWDVICPRIDRSLDVASFQRIAFGISADASSYRSISS